MPTDRSEPTLPNLICRSAPVEEVSARLNVPGVDIDEVDFKGWSGLHWALVREIPEVIKLMLDSGAGPNFPTGTGRLPLNIAMRSGQGDAVKMLLKAGADSEAADSDGKTPHMVGIAGKYPELVKLLTEWSGAR
ncbi:MAG: ankyrin repeat domain-containing protein [Chloroflexi bacterium]|jgi:ankyrin repeat protein|nr:ankyrin repeat domain-containing protein [Chloroflexota bacterium]MBT5627506.1 ankyrin repeat domain-containing protein [Chloroflexota bacterium]